MNCRSVQHRLLILEDPARPAGELRAHLQECLPCRQWHQRLLHLESQVALLPVPAPRTAAEAVHHFLTVAPTVRASAAAASAKTPPPILSLQHGQPRLRRLIPRYRWYAALAATAALFLLLFDWAVLRHTAPPATVPPELAQTPPQDPLVATLVERDVRLARAESSTRRLEILADIADELHGQTRSLVHAANPDDLRRLAGFYDRVVRDGIVNGAPSLPAAQRTRVLDTIAGRLGRTGQEATRLAAEIPEPSGDALRQIAATARQGSDRLRELAVE